jgi:hypothetical protein
MGASGPGNHGGHGLAQCVIVARMQRDCDASIAGRDQMRQHIRRKRRTVTGENDQVDGAVPRVWISAEDATRWPLPQIEVKQ